MEPAAQVVLVAQAVLLMQELPVLQVELAAVAAAAAEVEVEVEVEVEEEEVVV